jgi:hypothetical protein
MRLILAQLIWTFDFELENEDKWEDWLEQRVLLFWEKKPLVVRMKNVRKST